MRREEKREGCEWHANLSCDFRSWASLLSGREVGGRFLDRINKINKMGDGFRQEGRRGTPNDGMTKFTKLTEFRIEVWREGCR